MSIFPTKDLLPKSETNADSFVSKYPQYNGKGVTIGILDTGVDPGAIGLSTLPDGGRKLIHVADCTGSGDVGMNTTAQAVKDERGWIIEKGIFGKEIVLDGSLNLQPFPTTGTGAGGKKNDESSPESTDASGAHENATTDTPTSMPVRLAFKRAYELFPKKLTARLQKHYARKFEDEQHRHAVSIRSDLAAWKEKYGGSNEPTKEQLRQRDDIMAKLDVLEGKLPATDPLKEDPGPLYQIILFYDGKDYRVVLDTESCKSYESTSVDLKALPAMTDYHKEFQYGTFSSVDMMNFVVNIYDNGKVVSVVVDAGAHGSHVAGIAARYHPCLENEEEANGVAFGAKIVALKIGDSRLGSMETGTAMTRAMIEAVKHKCDVINLSYGEGCAMPNDGRFVQLAENLVYKHGIAFVSSAGNNGPALSTVGAPGGTTDAIIGVAAYVSPAMMETEYSMQPKVTKDGKSIEENNGTTYTWSSVGPTADGALGVDVTAPGAAITCVPNWCLQRSQLMNGTSMSSPNATGCVALLLSAAKAEGIKLSPVRLKRALMNTAQVLPGLSSLQQGFGMIDVDRAWEYIKETKDDQFDDINFKTRIINRPGGPRGVYLRQEQEVAVKQSFTVEIDPVFATADNVDFETQRQRIEFEMKFELNTNSDFVTVPKFFMLMHNGRSFKFEVDPTNLSSGVHTANICAFDTARPGTGPRFVIPITVVKPIADKATSISLGQLEFAPNEVKRFFLNVPADATWMDVAIKDERSVAVDKETAPRLLALHTLQLLPHSAYRDAEKQKYLNLLPSQETVTSIPVHPGVTCEMDVARYWSTVGTTKVTASVRFRGVTVVPNSMNIQCGGGGAKVRLQSNIDDEYIVPKAKLSKWKSPLPPIKSGVISPCDERDILTSNGKQIYQLVLTYEFTNKEEGAFVPRVPALQGFLYESGFESQLMLIFDEDKKYLGVADSWPSEIKAPKGKITIRLQIRHDDVKKLDLMKSLTIWIERKLSKELSLSAYKTHRAMVTGGDSWTRSLLRQGTTTSVFLGEPSNIPAECKCGDVLTGSATFADGPSELPGSGKRPGGFEVNYVVGTKMKDEKEEKAKTPEVPDERSIDDKIKEAVRSAKLEQLQKLSEKKDSEKDFISLYDQLIESYPGHLPLLMTALKFHDRKDSRLEKLDSIVKAADAVIESIDELSLAQHFGLKNDDEDAASCKARKENEDKKSNLVEALARKARAIADTDSSTESGEDTRFDDAMKHLQKWESLDDSNKFAVLSLEKLRRAGHFGSMLKILTSLLEKNGDGTKDGFAPMTRDDINEERRKVLEHLTFTHLKDRDFSWKIVTSVKEYALF